MELPALRRVEESGRWNPAWPDADVVVLPGLPGWSGTAHDRVQNPYPETTVDTVNILRSHGCTVEHALERGERQEISLNAAEFWVPVLVFAAELGIEATVDLLMHAIRQIVGTLQLPRQKLHLRFGQQRPDGTVDYLEVHGDADKVIEAICCLREGEGGRGNRQ